MESTKTEPLARIWSDDNGEVKQTKVSGYSVTLSRSIYGAKEREGELYNVDNLQTQNGYMFEPGDSVTLNIDDDGVVDMFSQLYTDPSSLQAEDVELMSWNDMIAKANEGIATYYGNTRPDMARFSSTTWHSDTWRQQMTMESSATFLHGYLHRARSFGDRTR